MDSMRTSEEIMMAVFLSFIKTGINGLFTIV